MMEVMSAPDVEALEIHEENPEIMHNAHDDDVPDDDCYWYDLSVNQKRAIEDPREYYIFAVIYGIPYGDKKRLLKCFNGPRVECLAPYNENQNKWAEKAAYFIGQTLGLENPKRSPEFIDEVINHISPEYRLYMLASNPALLDTQGVDDDETAHAVKKFCVSLRRAKLKFQSEDLEKRAASA